jgi:hypothetical protein
MSVAQSPSSATAPEDLAKIAQAKAAQLADAKSATEAMQKFWASQSAETEALMAGNALLSFMPREEAAASIGAGFDFHLIWTSEKLISLHDKLDGDKAALAALPLLKAALLAKGGWRNNARRVGMLVFNEAEAVHKERQENPSAPFPVAIKRAAATPPPAAAPLGERQQGAKKMTSQPAMPPAAAPPPQSSSSVQNSPPPAAVAAVAVQPAAPRAASPAPVDFDEVVYYVVSAAVPASAAINIRCTPGGEVVREAYPGSEFAVIGRKGDWLKLDMDGQTGWALSCTGTMELLCPKIKEQQQPPQPPQQQQAPVQAQAQVQPVQMTYQAPATGGGDVEQRMQAMENEITLLRAELRAFKSRMGAACAN